MSGRASSRARQRSHRCSTSAAFQMLCPRCFDQGKWHGKDRKLTWGEMDVEMFGIPKRGETVKVQLKALVFWFRPGEPS